MNATIRKLLELQELNITLRESEIVHGAHEESGTAGIRQRVEALRSELSPEHLARFDRLSRQSLAVVKVLHGTCMGCNIGIARGDVNRISTGKLEPICPHCGRFVQVQE